MEQNSSEADRSSNNQEFPACYGTRKFIIVFTRSRHLSLSWARTIQYMPQSHFLKIHFNIILPSTPVLSKLFVSLRFPQQTTLPSPYMLHVPPISFSWFGHAYYIWWRVQIIKLFVMLYTPLLPRPAKAQISSSAPCSRAPSPYVPPTMCETAVSFTPILQQCSSVNCDIIFSDSNLEGERFCTECA
jgi:hypothetical protein